MSLKLTIVLGAILAVCTALTNQQIKQRATVHARLCMQKTGVSRDALHKVWAGDYSVTDDKCFAKCFFEELGFMNAEGDFLDTVAIERLSKHADKDKVEAMVNTCKDRMGTTPCETAYKMFQCFVEHKTLFVTPY